ncbi:MAG: acetate--CoA ligase [Bdellovibrionales bacterium]|nr:acetate--CoA ligase [Bdellovibrionales bacterium]
MDSMVYPSKEFSEKAYIQSMDQYQEMYKKSVSDPGGFWSQIAKDNFYWEKPFTHDFSYNYDMTKGPIEIEWFEDGVTNITYNCLDRHLEKNGDRTALIFEGNEPGDNSTLTYKQLHQQVCKFANVLKTRGVKKGDRVALYMPMTNELVIATLACARIGAVHSVVFGGFSAESLANRILDSKCEVLITADGCFRGQKLVPTKSISDSAMDICEKEGFHVKTCIMFERLGNQYPETLTMKPNRDLSWQEMMNAASEDCPPTWMNSEDPLFILYTSGSTGKPKGVLHTVGGYMVYTATTFKYIFDYRPEDIYWCTADVGWITGHSYITYGPLANCATQVIFEGIPTYPDAGRFWDVVDRHKVSIFYTAPTAIRAIAAKGDEFVKKHKRSSLRLLGSVGEPINAEAWRWYHDVVGEGRCPIVDTWWQTETGGILLTSLPGATPMKPGSTSFPFFGAQPVVLDAQSGKELEGATQGVLAFQFPWPGQMRTVYGDHQRFEKTYFEQYKGYYFTGDGCRRDEDGYIWVTGRVDDVMNVSGHRIGTAEVESALDGHAAVAEAAVVGIPHEIKGQGIYAYVTLNAGHQYTDDLKTELSQHVRKEIGAFAAPEVIHWAPELPKTRSGKIMRRILRKIAAHEEEHLGDLTTLADPGVVERLLESRP